MPSDAPEIVLTYSRLQRASVYLLPVLVGAVLLFAAWTIAAGTFLDTFAEPPHMVLVWGLLLVSLPLNLWQSTNTVLSSVHLAEATLHRARPLKDDTRISLNDIRRVFLGGASIEIYASNDDSPDLTVERDLPGIDAFIDALAQRLPPAVPIDNPSGEFDDLLAARAEPVTPPDRRE